MTTIILILAVLWLAYSNGANDNFKGVATLYGSSTMRFKPALWWATITTAAGSLASVIAAKKLIVVFSGKGLVSPSLLGTPELLIAVGLGSAMTIFLATVLGMPTSTTHALTGGLLGVSVVTSSHLAWGAALRSFAGPLLLSPLIAIIMAALFYLAFRKLRLVLGIRKDSCLCFASQPSGLVRVRADGAAVASSSGLTVGVGHLQDCARRYQGQFVGIDAQQSVDVIHYISAGAVCFSRAVNDTPKIAALLLATRTWDSSLVLALVATAMVLGGLLNSRRVAETMSRRITDLNPGQGLSANLVTASLVLFASQFGLPVSTTHVSCGSIFGIGLVNRVFHWKTVAEILTTWATTLPLGGALAGLIFWLMHSS